MNISQIENNIKSVFHNIINDSFIYDFLLAYNIPKASIKKLKDGGTNLSKQKDEILWKKKLFYKIELIKDLHELIDNIRGEENIIKHTPRFIIVTNFETFLSFDTTTLESLDIPFLDLPKYFDFFLPLAGMEKAQHQFENPADVKAAERMGKLYDEIKKDNATETQDEVHSLNIFLTRLLFCFFAEDTNIFEDGQFTGSISSHTQQDGSDLNAYFERLFEIMNTPKDERGDIPEYLNSFPYVNGGLFRDYHKIPIFSRRSRQIIIESGELDWSSINPDIFGSMIQAVITPEHRGGLGMHYTSVPNIMKVIEPLFLDELNEEFDKSIHEPRKLYILLDRLGKIKIFDPACGSGNFLIIAYKELRQLEIKILYQLKELQSIASGFEPKQLELIPKQQLTLAASFQIQMFSRVELSQFYGIELDDFAHEVAILSLWLAQHQMNVKFKEIFGSGNPTLPLQNGGNIIHGNACRINWDEVCPKIKGEEIYILGNPPYLGSRRQDDNQKEDLKLIFGEDYKSIDYIAAWFLKGANYIKNFNSKFAFVSTNSICQGEQVSLIWKKVLSEDIEISFAHKDFKWTNNAKSNAAVIVVIVGLQNKKQNFKYLYNSGIKAKVISINPYLVEGRTIYIQSRQRPLSNFPEMNFGNMPADGGKLLFTTEEKNDFILKEPKSEDFFRKLISAYEFLNGRERWCLWLVGIDLNTIKKMPLVQKRVEELYKIRKESSRPQLAEIPHLFAQITQPKDQDFILIPKTTSENREYIPISYFNSENISSDSCLIIPTNNLYIMGIVTSKMHMVWVNSVCGRLKTDYRYSKDIVYNNFPFPKINEEQKKDIEIALYKVLEERENFSEKTLSDLYDPQNMPLNLKKAHNHLDLIVDRCYRLKPFDNNEERLEHLFKLYEQMIEDEKSKGTLFEVEPKQKKKKK